MVVGWVFVLQGFLSKVCCTVSLIMSGEGDASLSSRTLNAVRHLAETRSDDIVLEKDTYLIDENNRVIPIPAGTTVLEHDETEINAAAANFSTTGDVQTSVDTVIPSAVSAEGTESDIQAADMQADSTCMDNMPVITAAAHGSGSVVSVACEVVEATSSDPNPSISLSDMFVQEEEEVMDESKPEEAVVSASGSLEDSTQSQSKDAGQKPGRKGAQRKNRKVSVEGKVDSGSHGAKRKKLSVPAAAEKPSLAAEKPAARSTSVSPAVATVSATGRPQRSTPRRSAYELLHGGELKPQRRPQPSTAESEQEGQGHSAKGHPSKKQKVSKSGAADDEERKQSEETKVAGEQGTAQRKGQKRRSSVQSTSQTSVSSEGCEGSSNCATPSNVCCASTDELKSSTCLSSSCTPAADDSSVVQSTSGQIVNSAEESQLSVPKTENKSVKSSDAVDSPSSKKQKQSKKVAQSKQYNSCPSHIAPVEKGSLKKVVGKHDVGSKSEKIKRSKKAVDVDDFKVPGKPYHYFTTEDDNAVSDSDDESSSSLAGDLASEDVDWMGRRIVELEQQVRRLQESSVPQDKRTSRCWQDVLAEFSELPSEDIDEKQLLTRYEQKLRALDRELDDRATFVRIREGCIARRERRILEKEGDLKKRERDLEHQRRVHGRVKILSESTADPNPVSPCSADSSSASNRKQAMEKEVRLELRKQALDRQKHVLDDERKKLAAKERELENREQALVDADLLNMASGFTSSSGVESRGMEASQTNGGTTVEFSDDDEDDFGGNSFSSFGATSVSLTFSLDRSKHDSDDERQDTSEVSCLCTSC